MTSTLNSLSATNSGSTFLNQSRFQTSPNQMFDWPDHPESSNCSLQNKSFEKHTLCNSKCPSDKFLLLVFSAAAHSRYQRNRHASLSSAFRHESQKHLGGKRRASNDLLWKRERTSSNNSFSFQLSSDLRYSLGVATSTLPQPSPLCNLRTRKVRASNPAL